MVRDFGIAPEEQSAQRLVISVPAARMDELAGRISALEGILFDFGSHAAAGEDPVRVTIELTGE